MEQAEEHPPAQEEKVEEGSEEGRFLTGPPWAGLTLAILSSTFLYALDNTIVANIRPSIIHDLGHIEKLPWISVAYALGETSSNPLWGNLYGIFDNKLLFCIAVTIFEVGSALCGAAPSVNVFIVGRVIAGLGGSGIYIGTLNVFSALTVVTERALYLSFVGMAWCLGTILGPIIGGAFAGSSATWRWAFYINLCIAAVAAPVYLWFLPSNPSNIRVQSRRLDFSGTMLFFGASLSLVMAISFGGAIYNWDNARIITLFVLSGLLWILFGLQQGLCVLTDREHRLFPVHFCRDLEMCLLFIETSISISLVIIPIYFIPLFFQFVGAESALQSGVRTLPLIVAQVLGCLVNGALFARFSYYQAWFLFGAALGVLGGGLLTTITPVISDGHIYGFSVIIGFGGGLFAQAGYAVGQARQPPANHTKVTAFLSCAQMSGLALSLGIGTSVFVSRAENGIAKALPDLPEGTIQATIAGTGSTILQNLDFKQKQVVLTIITEALRDIFIMASVVAGVGVLLSLLMKRERLFSSNY